MEFIKLVQRMRELQKKYFRTRMSSVLHDCKILEKEVDEYILAHTQEKEKPVPSLF